jgi:hypothetical protein
LVDEDALDEESDEEVESVLLVLDDSLLPSGGGGGPPALPEKVLENTFFSSLAWLLVSLPLETSPLMRSSILDCMSPDEGADVELELDAPLLSDESMSSSADESEDSSLELMVPAETSLVSSLLRRSSGEEYELVEAAEIEVIAGHP